MKSSEGFVRMRTLQGVVLFIFLLIAGTYTPFALIPLHGSFGWTIFGLVWGMALVGIVFQCFAAKRFRIVRTLCYLGMGWFAVFMVKPLLETLPIEAIWWLVAGAVGLTMLALLLATKVRDSGCITLPQMSAQLLGPQARPLMSGIIVVAWTAILAAQFQFHAGYGTAADGAGYAAKCGAGTAVVSGYPLAGRAVFSANRSNGCI